MTGTVRWRESVLALAEAGVTEVVEVGAKVLGPMVKRTVPDMTVVSVVTADDVRLANRSEMFPSRAREGLEVGATAKPELAAGHPIQARWRSHPRPDPSPVQEGEIERTIPCST